MSLRPGTRLILEGIDERYCPELASKRELWDSPPQNRTGVVLSTQEIIGERDYYVIALDKPLNIDHPEISESLTKTYIASSIRPAKKHVIIARTRDVESGKVSVLTDFERQVTAATLRSVQDRIFFCHHCKRAQKARNMLMTCDEQGHMMCKKDLVPWVERENRADMTKCGEYTKEMKLYCRNTMGYEPTYIPTRVLLGLKYWETEDKMKAVQEFCEYDLWVCFICRFHSECKSRRSRNSNVKFGFIHEQLFPLGADDEAGAIMTVSDRDELSQFGQGGEVDDTPQDDAFLQLSEDLILYAWNPVERTAHLVHCKGGWTLGNILRETLKVSRISYNADIVIYKLDNDGWEVELCDLRLVDLEEDAKGVRDGSGESVQQLLLQDMASVKDLTPNDVLVIRMRSLHKIGARSHLQGLGVTDPSFGKQLSKIVSTYGGFRRIGGDGNCYYRAIAYGALEQIVLRGNKAGFGRLADIFGTVQYAHTGDREAHIELLATLREAEAGEVWHDADELQSTFLSKNSNFDFALINACRHLLSTYLIENQDQVMDNGLSLQVCLMASEGDEDVDMETYCNAFINQMGRDAEGPYIELGILPNLLHCRCVIFNLDMRSMSENEIACPYTGDTADEPLAELHILLRPGHYDLLYTPTMTFSSEHIRHHIEQSCALQLQRAEEKGMASTATTGKAKEGGRDEDGPESPAGPLSTRADSKESHDNANNFASTGAKMQEVGGLLDDPSSSSSSSRAVREMRDMFPALSESHARRLLSMHDFDVAAAVDEYLVRGDPDTKGSPVPGGFEADREIIFKRLSHEMSEIEKGVLRDAVEHGDCRTQAEVRRYIEQTRRESDREGKREWLPSIGSMLMGRGSRK